MDIVDYTTMGAVCTKDDYVNVGYERLTEEQKFVLKDSWRLLQQDIANLGVVTFMK